MNKGIWALVGLALVLGGCTNQVRYGDAEAVETTTIEFGSSDLQKIASDMTDSMLSSPAVASLTKSERPIVFVESIKNKTAEHIDTESITDTISTRLLNSGEFRFVDMGRVDAVRKQLDFQNNDQLVNPATAIQFGRMVGAQYMLYGNLASIVKRDGNDKDVYYKMTMRLMDLQTGLIEWLMKARFAKKSPEP